MIRKLCRATFLGAVLSFGVSAIAIAQPASACDEDDTLGCANLPVLRVPSTAYPTIQSAVDAVPVGGAIIRVAPGVYTESIQVAAQGVRITGAGAGKTHLLAPESTVPAISFAAGAGGDVEDLLIVGGNHGIEGIGSVIGAVGGNGPSIAIRRVIVTGSGRGIFGTFSNLNLRAVSILRTAWNGMSVSAAQLIATDSIISNAGGVGILVTGVAPGVGVVLDGLTLNNNSNGGIEIQGNPGPVMIRNCTLLLNGRAGIFLDNAGSVTIESTIASFTQSINNGALGDGIDVFGSNPVTVSFANIDFNARSGIAVFASGTTEVDNSNLLYNAFALDAEPSASFTFEDPSNVVCFDQGETACQVLSSSPQPPQPISN